MHGEVLGRRDGLVVMRVVALEAAHERDAEPAGQVWVFAVGLLSASPAGVAEDIDVWRPDRETEVDGVNVVANRLVILGACFGRDRLTHLPDQAGVPGGGHAD